MQMETIDPLYKLLCLLIIFLVPLIPAWALYKIAPSEGFTTSGFFSGFKINATGAAAIYIVLFVAIYVWTGDVLKGIDSNARLLETINQLKRSRPWKVEYKLKLMAEDGIHEISPHEYLKYLNPDSINCFSPEPIQFNMPSRTITFYVDSEFLKDDTIHSQVLMGSQYRSQPIEIVRKMARPNDRVITVASTFFRTKAKPRQILAINNKEIAVLSVKTASKHAPVINNLTK